MRWLQLCTACLPRDTAKAAKGTDRQFIAAPAVQVLPSELFQAHTAVEYVLSQPVTAPPAFVFVVDVAGDAADLEV